MYFSLQEKLELWLFKVRDALEKAMTRKQDFHLNTGNTVSFELVVWYVVMYMLCSSVKVHNCCIQLHAAKKEKTDCTDKICFVGIL